jgi:hypothetical protein
MDWMSFQSYCVKKEFAVDLFGTFNNLQKEHNQNVILIFSTVTWYHSFNYTQLNLKVSLSVTTVVYNFISL